MPTETDKTVADTRKKMFKSCPITYKKVDETSVRMHAGFISLLGLLFIVQADLIVLLILLYDFSVRIGGYPKASPFYFVSRFIVRTASLPSHQVDAGPKQFAAKIGLIFVVAALALYLLGYVQLSSYVIGVLTLCALLEAGLAFCVGCEVYPLWRAIVDRQKK
jgi:hypothetical protein